MRWAALLAVVIVGCSRPSAPAPTPSAPDPWKTEAIGLQGASAVLWNGRLGVRVGMSGLGAEGANALPAFRDDRYQPGGEEKILPVSTPLPIHVRIGEHVLADSDKQDLVQTLDLKTGVLASQWRFGDVRVQNETVISPSERAIVQKWRFNGLGGRPATLVPAQGGDFATSTPAVATAASPEIVWEAFGDTQAQYQQVRRASEQRWAERWAQSDIEIDGPVEDQRYVRTLMFYLRTAVSPEQSVGPFGLSNTLYNGHIFWDADLWVMPALAFVEPQAAASIARYRLRMFGQAQQNYQNWLAAGRPIANGKLGPNGPVGGAMYPWESSVSGKETVPGPSRFQHHITGTVAFTLDWAASIGLVSRTQVDPVIRAAGVFYSARTEPGAKGRILRQTMSPDEHFTGDNDLYTNLLARWAMNGGRWSGAAQVYLPRDAKSLLTYDNDRFKGYKQAAALLAVFPLQAPEAEKQAQVMLDRFEGGVTANGPAMADAIHATIRARLGDAEGAYTIWLRDRGEFVKGPHELYSEKRHRPITYFVTGAGGALQAVIYGFLGFRVGDAAAPGAVWTAPLEGGKVLSIRPRLPKAWKSVRFDFVVNGKRYRLVAQGDSATVNAR